MCQSSFSLAEVLALALEEGAGTSPSSLQERGHGFAQFLQVGAVASDHENPGKTASRKDQDLSWILAGLRGQQERFGYPLEKGQVWFLLMPAQQKLLLPGQLLSQKAAPAFLRLAQLASKLGKLVQLFLGHLHQVLVAGVEKRSQSRVADLRYGGPAAAHPTGRSLVPRLPSWGARAPNQPPTRALMPPKPPRSARQSLAPLAPTGTPAKPDVPSSGPAPIPQPAAD